MVSREENGIDCESLHDIVVPNVGKVLKKWAFSDRHELTTVILGYGLEEIGVSA